MTRVKGREGVVDMQQALQTALVEAGDRLLVAGRAGIGKTREIAELARNLCARKWKICVARIEGEARLGALSTLPPELLDSRLLIMVDNLHARIRASEDQPIPYVERLEAFLKSLDGLVPGKVRAIAITRDEPLFQRQLELPPPATRWRSFGVFRLPEFTLAGLREILINLAGRVSVPVAVEDIGKLVENSDRKPETLFINVDLARQKGTSLNRRDWLPTEGDSWRERSLAARARYPAAEQVYHALWLLSTARLPARVGYVAGLGRALGGRDTAHAIEGLVNEGLIGLRQNTLSLFSVEQLEDTMEDPPVRSRQLAQHWDAVVQALTDPAEPPPEWHDDLTELSFCLTQARLPARAADVASLAIERGTDTARVFLARGAGRFLAGALRGADEDLSAVLARDEKDSNAFYLRGLIRNFLGDFAGAVADAERAIALGCDDGDVYLLVGMGHYQQGHWRDPGRTGPAFRPDTLLESDCGLVRKPCVYSTTIGEADNARGYPLRGRPYSQHQVGSSAPSPATPG